MRSHTGCLRCLWRRHTHGDCGAGGVCLLNTSNQAKRPTQAVPSAIRRVDPCATMDGRRGVQSGQTTHATTCGPVCHGGLSLSSTHCYPATCGQPGCAVVCGYPATCRRSPSLIGQVARRCTWVGVAPALCSALRLDRRDRVCHCDAIFRARCSSMRAALSAASFGPTLCWRGRDTPVSPGQGTARNLAGGYVAYGKARGSWQDWLQRRWYPQASGGSHGWCPGYPELRCKGRGPGSTASQCGSCWVASGVALAEMPRCGQSPSL